MPRTVYGKERTYQTYIPVMLAIIGHCGQTTEISAHTYTPVAVCLFFNYPLGESVETGREIHPEHRVLANIDVQYSKEP